MKNFWTDLTTPFFVLAPMEEVTDVVFREIVADLAPPHVFFTEFTSTDGLLSSGRERVIQNLEYTEKQRPIVAQIWGITPESFYKSAQLVQELGFDGVDINMGCPAKSVTSKGSGSAHINNPSLAAEIIAATKEGASEIPTSVKTRIGYNDVVTEEWCGFLLEQKIATLSIHGRTRAQQSKVPADWSEISKVSTIRNSIAPETVIVGNGDVLSYNQGVEYAEKYSVEGIMIGRGIFQNPWVFSKNDHIDKKSVHDRLALLLKHTQLFEEKWGNTKNFATLKKFFKIYVKGFRGADKLRQQLMETRNAGEVEQIIKSY